MLAGVGAAPAAAIAPGETVVASALTLPAGALSGAGTSGVGQEGATRVAVSGSGRFIAFVSAADGLDRAAPRHVTSVFRKDRLTGEVVLVSRASGMAGPPANAVGEEVRISDDGRRVAWVTRAAIDPADADGGLADVYVRDVGAGITLLATGGATDAVRDYDLSGDGDWIAFATQTALAGADDLGGRGDVYRRRLADGATTLVSRAATGPGNAGGWAGSPSISDTGGWVAFVSDGTDLIDGFTGSADGNVYVRDMAAGRTHLVSSLAGHPAAGAGASSRPELAGAPASGNLAGVKIAFVSRATALDAEDASARESVFRRQLSEDRARLVSPAQVTAWEPTISDDGRRVSYTVGSNDLPDVAVPGVVYVRDVTAGTTAIGSAGPARVAGGSALSGDGGLVAWVAERGVTADADPDHAAVHARALDGGSAQLVSRPPGEAPFLAPAASVERPRLGGRRISADGRWTVFAATSRRLPGGDGYPHAYRRDLVTGAVELVSRNASGAPVEGVEPTISADGRRVAFLSSDSVDPLDVNGQNDVYLRDLAAETTTLVSRGDGFGGAFADGAASAASLSADGRHVAWVTWGSTVGGAPGTHVYLRDVDGGRTQLVDRASGVGGVVANAASDAPVVSADGRFVAFLSSANNLDPADGPPATDDDVYLRDTVAGTTELVSRRDGAAGAKAAGESDALALSDDGSRIVFALRGGLEPATGPGSWTSQVYLRDRAAATTTRISEASDGRAGDEESAAPAISGDGAVIAFETSAGNLPGSAPTGARRVLARQVATGAWASAPPFGSGDPQEAWIEGEREGAVAPSLSGNGRCLAFVARGAGPAAGDAGDLSAAYVHALGDGCLPSPPAGGGGGSAPPAGGPPANGAGAGPVRPSLRKVSMLRRRFRVGRRPTAQAAEWSGRRTRRVTPAGTAFRFTLGAPATVTIAIERAAAGRRMGGRCRPPARGRRQARPCVRWVAAGTLTRRALAPGRRSVAFSGRIGRRALRPGRHRAKIVARNGAGRSATVTLRFTVVRR